MYATLRKQATTRYVSMDMSLGSFIQVHSGSCNKELLVRQAV